MEQDLSRRERKKQETRERILTVAREMLASQGFEATTLEQVAEAADVSKATFYNYFPNKDALLRQIAKAEVEAVGDQMAQEPEHLASPLAIIRRSMELTYSDASPVLRVIRRILLVDVLQSGKTPEPIAEMGTMLVDLVHQAQDQGELRSDLDATQLANAIGAAYLAAWAFCRHLDAYPSSLRKAYSVTAVAASLMAGIGITV